MQPVVVHAHFYQPERENPWTGVLEPEPSAAPFRDWNERIHDDCYRPNAVARVFDEQRRVERIVNNFEALSFDAGPTLLRWLERRRPHTYAKVVDGDWRSARSGHGNALAQAYHHAILPLASERDRRTEIRWGLADFHHRFGRPARGMWLPETAADQPTLDALIDAGVAFTVLAPHQAWRVRPDGGEWHEAGGRVDTGQAYRVAHSDGSGRSLAVFFYDGGLAQWLAFDEAAADAGQIVRRLAAAAPGGGGLVHAALDGETFGHHRRFGDLGLAYALFEAAAAAGLEPTSYAAWLAEHPPAAEAEVVGGEGTAWSCAHGLGRWYRDCGCATDSAPGWDQRWRTPVRQVLDTVRDAAAAVFEERGGSLLKDPWAARDDYVRVRLGEVGRQPFLDRHALRNLGDGQQADLWTLVESQRHALAMYTSCGWFFADVSGIETVYVLRSAARVLDLLGEVGAGAGLREQVVDALGEARSNRPGMGTGADVWRRQVEPSAVTPARVTAHLCLAALARPGEASSDATGRALRSGGLEVTVREVRTDRRARQAMVTGRVTATSRLTGRSRDLAAAGLHLGGLDFYGLVADDPGAAEFARRVGPLWEAFPAAPIARLLRQAAEVFGDGAEEFDLDAAIPGSRQEIVGAVFGELAGRFSQQYARLYHDHRRILEMLAGAGYDLPRDLRAAAELTLTSQLESQLAEARASFDGPGAPDDEAFTAIRQTLALARTYGYALDLSGVATLLGEAVTAAAERAARTLEAGAAALVETWIDVSREAGVDVDLSRPQEHAWEAALQARAGRLRHDQAEVVAGLGRAVGLSPVAWTPRHG